MMKITNQTLLQQKAVMFLDGAETFTQIYDIYVDGQKIQMTKTVNGQKGKKTEVLYSVCGESYTDMKEAFETYGFVWEKTV